MSLALIGLATGSYLEEIWREFRYKGQRYPEASKLGFFWRTYTLNCTLDKVMAFALLYWHEEGKWSVLTVKAIEEPRLPFDSYEIGMEVKARYQGKAYPCVTLGISG